MQEMLATYILDKCGIENTREMRDGFIGVMKFNHNKITRDKCRCDDKEFEIMYNNHKFKKYTDIIFKFMYSIVNLRNDVNHCQFTKKSREADQIINSIHENYNKLVQIIETIENIEKTECENV